MEKSKNFIIPLIIYPFDVMISIGQTDIELIKSVKKYGLTKDDIHELLDLPTTLQGRAVLLFETNHSFIRLKKSPKTTKEFGTLAHEIFHSVDFILRTIGITLSKDSDEAYAYLIGYLTEKIYDNL